MKDFTEIDNFSREDNVLNDYTLVADFILKNGKRKTVPGTFKGVFYKNSSYLSSKRGEGYLQLSYLQSKYGKYARIRIN